MIDKDANETGLIDLTEAKVTVCQSTFQYQAFGQEALEKLISYYREAGGIYWPAMKEQIIELKAAYLLRWLSLRSSQAWKSMSRWQENHWK